jgi:hypothetical protein
VIFNKFKKSVSQPNVYLHIGLNKTGSTALQSYFFDNSTLLKSNGILYPKTGLVGSAHYSLSASLGFCNPSVNSVWFKDKKKLKKAFLNEIDASTDTVIFSSEDFLLNKPIESVQNFFKGFNVKVVVYLRRHDHWWLSAYSQAVKMKRLPPWNLGPQGFINFNRQRNKRYGNYRHIVDRWADFFGKENIIVRPYEKEQNVPSLAGDFLTVMGRPELVNQLPEMENRENTGLPLKAIQYMDIFQRVETDDQSHATLIKYSKTLVKGDSCQLSALLKPEFRRKLIEENLADYQYIAREYMGRDDGQLFYEALPRLDPEWTPPAWPTNTEIAATVIKAVKS